MKIQWHNVFILIFALFALILMLNNREVIGTPLAAMRCIGPGHSVEEQIIGLITLSLILTCIVAVVRLIVAATRDGK